MRSAQEQYERYAHISRQLSIHAAVTDDPIAAERRALWASRSAKQQESQCVVSRLVGNTSAGDDKLSQEVHLNKFDDVKEQEVHGYKKLHRLCILSQNGPSDPRWDDVREYLSQLSSKDTAILTSTQKGGNNPLHICCFLSPPVDVVQQIIQLCPDSATMTNDHGETALGLACHGFVPACEAVIHALVKAFPSSRNHVNSFTETPLHIHLNMSRSYHVDPSPFLVRQLTTVDAVNTKDRRGYTPLCILGKGASESMTLFASCIHFFSTPTSHESSNIDNYKKCLHVLLDNDPSRESKTQFLRDLLHFPKSLLVVSFEKEHTRCVLNDICGRGPYIALLMTDFYIQLMIIISFTIGCNFGFKGNGTTTAMLFGSAYWIFRRVASAMGSSSIMALLNESFRLMHLIQALALMSASIYLRNNGTDLLYEEGVSGTWRNVLILTSGLIWLNLLGIGCHTLKGFSVFVYATIQIFKQLINLFLVFILIFVSFSTMLYISSVDSPGYCTPEGDAPGEYCTLNDAMNKIGVIFFGAVEAEDFDLPRPTLVLFILYNIFVIIILLNIIIAIMSDSYTDVNQRAELVFWNHRFDLIHDVDAFVNCFTHFLYCQKRTERQKAAALEKSNDESRIKTDWFVQFVNLQRGNRFIPKAVADLLIGIIMMFWLVAGLFTVGLVWPRHIRRKIFSPTTTDHVMKTNDDAEGDEMLQMKEENSLLAKENATLTEQVKRLRMQLTTVGKGDLS